MTLAELRRQRAERLQRIQSIAQEEAGLSAGESLSEEMITEFDQLEAEVADLDAKILRQEKANQAAAVLATPVAPGIKIKQRIQKAREEKPGDGFARYVMCVAASNGDITRAAEFAEERFGDLDMAAAIDTQTPDSAGVLVHEDYSNEMIELLTPRTVIRRMGARSIPMPNGNLTMGRKTGRGQATYGPEGSDIKATKPTFGQMKFSAKKLTALTPVSNDLIRQASYQATALVRDDLVDAVALAEDSAFLRSTGDGDSPKGLRHQTHESNIIPASAADVNKAKPDLHAVDSFLNSLINKQRKSDAPMLRCGWILSPSVFTFLDSLRDGNGNKVYPELAQGKLKNFPVEFTNQLPENLGDSGNESEIYFVDMSQVLIADTMMYRIAISTDATYKDGDELVSAFSRDQTVMRIIAEHDFGLRHDKACSIATGIKWGIE
ncbi:phage major capsid protein [Vibrio metschnikovii]|nr:phage major capsid protein [Vibrio metschnikovii]